MEDSVTNSHPYSLLKPGTLWETTKKKTQFARECGALKSIETEYHLIQQDHIPFVILSLSNIVRREQAKKKQQQQENKTGTKIDPFLPYEEDLFVGDISPSHLCLLNKFNVVDNHLLIVTRAFESQTDLLDLADFTALWCCMQEIDGLAFFNGGKQAGASQRHKHLQLIPLPFLNGVVDSPLKDAIANVSFTNSLGKIASFPFRHGVADLDLSLNETGEIAASTMLKQYHTLLNYVGLNVDAQSKKQPGAYNFLATREWMLIVPRAQESYQNISINSLGFAGSLFVRDRHSLQLLQELTPIKLLAKVTYPPLSHA